MSYINSKIIAVLMNILISPVRLAAGRDRQLYLISTSTSRTFSSQYLYREIIVSFYSYLTFISVLIQSRLKRI